MISARFEGFDGMLAELSAELDSQAARAMDQVTVIVANRAASSHRYTSRTGRLQNGTVPAGVRGSLMRGSLQGTVLGDTPYGSYLEEPGASGGGFFDRGGSISASRWAFLYPAYLSVEESCNAAFDTALNVGF